MSVKYTHFVYIVITIIIMFKSLQSHATYAHFKTSHAEVYHVDKIYMITASVVRLFYMIMCHTCITCNIIIILYCIYVTCISYILVLVEPSLVLLPTTCHPKAVPGVC